MPLVKSIYQSAKSRAGARKEAGRRKLPTPNTHHTSCVRTHSLTRSVRRPQPSQPCKNFYFFFVSASGLSSRTLQKNTLFLPLATFRCITTITTRLNAHDAQFLLRSRRHFGTKSFLHNGWIVVSWGVCVSWFASLNNLLLEFITIALAWLRLALFCNCLLWIK